MNNENQNRNGNIANAFYKAGFIESWGRGISKIREGFTSKGFAKILLWIFAKKRQIICLDNFVFVSLSPKYKIEA